MSSATPTQPKRQPVHDRPTIKLKRPSCQPSKAELEEPITVPPGTTPQDVLRAVCRTVNVVYEH